MREFFNIDKIDFAKVKSELKVALETTQHKELRRVYLQLPAYRLLELSYSMIMKKSYDFMDGMDLNDPKCLAQILTEYFPKDSVENIKKKARMLNQNSLLDFCNYFLLTPEVLFNNRANYEMLLKCTHPEFLSYQARCKQGSILKFLNVDEIPPHCKLTATKKFLNEMWMCLEHALSKGMTKCLSVL